jgi:hypothetical protein
MAKFKLFLPAALCAALCGCASFTSGDVKVDKETAQQMLADNSIKPFADIQLDWKNYPYRAPSEHVATGATIDEHGKFRAAVIKPVSVPPEDRVAMLRRARKVFGSAGLFDRKKGQGTLRLTLTSMNRWTYGELFRSFFVETGFIFILPASLPVNYLLTADFATSTGTARVELLGRNNTTFHFLLAPLYPFLAPASGEKSLMNQMLWRAATDIYSAMDRAAKAPKQQPIPQPKPQEAAPQAAPVPAAHPATAPEPETPAETLVEPPEGAAQDAAPAQGSATEQGEVMIGAGMDSEEPETSTQTVPAGEPAVQAPAVQPPAVQAPAVQAPAAQPAVAAPQTEQPSVPAEETPDD